MKQMIDSVRNVVRRLMGMVAVWLDKVSRGRVTPNMVTWTGLMMHVPIMVLIGTNHLIWAAILLIIFGLFDTLDGSLARHQKRTSDAGGILDATTDRVKEVLIYSGLAYLFVVTRQAPEFIALTVLACGASICVSFVKSKGETVVASQQKKHDYVTLNKMFGGGMLPFEMRMTLLVIGLFLGVSSLIWVVLALGVLSLITVFQRFSRIAKQID